MDRRALTTAVVFVIVGAIALALMQFVLHVQGAVLKLVIGIVVGLIAAAIAYYFTKPTATTP